MGRTPAYPQPVIAHFLGGSLRPAAGKVLRTMKCRTSPSVSAVLSPHSGWYPALPPFSSLTRTTFDARKGRRPPERLRAGAPQAQSPGRSEGPDGGRLAKRGGRSPRKATVALAEVARL